jgi:non-ribosomal peptide synthase protein (TIGR01720 family)
MEVVRGPKMFIDQLASLVMALQRSAASVPDGGYAFLEEGERQECGFVELDRRARAIAAMLQEQGAAGSRVLLLYPPGLDYVAGFFGCLYAGAVAVPAYPPDPMRLERTLPRLQAICRDARAGFALTTSFVLELRDAVFSLAPELAQLRWLATDALPQGAEAGWKEPGLRRESLCFLQYTSGSTGTPKGVMLTHGNLLEHAKRLQHAYRTGSSTRSVIWLPPFHDMGLIGGILQAAVTGYPCTLMSPMSFLERPFRWLEAISRESATLSGGPDFAYALCVRKISAEARATLDLSHWRVAFSGAEPVRAETLERFAETFGPCGFDARAFYPSYGLAEATLVVTAPAGGELPVVAHLSSDALTQGRAEVAAPDAPGTRRLVGCGTSLPGQQVVIVEPATGRRCPPGAVGEIWVRGPSVAQGYWGRPEETEQTFGARLTEPDEGPFLRTGDLGFLHGGELFISSRLKDLIILRGRNHYPQDLERTAEGSHPALRSGCSAAFSIEQEGEERLVLVAEVEGREGQPVEPAEIFTAMRRALTGQHEVAPAAIALLPRGTVPKTSSGKIQRHACRAAFLAGTLEALASWQAPTGGAGEEEGDAGHLLTPAGLAAVPPAERHARIAGFLRETVARSLQIPPAEVDLQASLAALGLDSLMQVELKGTLLARLGVSLPTHVLEEVRHLEELASRVSTHLGGEKDEAPLEAAPGPVPLTPAQHFFFSKDFPSPHHWNVAFMLKVPSAMDSAALETFFRALLDQHDGLRMRFTPGAGGWEQRDAGPGQAGDFFSRHDFSAVPDEALAAELEREAAALQTRLDLSRGPLVRVAHFELGAGRPGRLLWIAHHLLLDAFSLTMVLAPDVQSACLRLMRGQTPRLPPRTAPFREWARRLSELAHSEEYRRDVDAWVRIGTAPAARLSRELSGLNLESSGACVAAALSAEETHRLFGEALRRKGIRPYDALVTALALALRQWTGEHAFLLHLVRHGRDGAVPGVDVSRTIGWLTSAYPALVELHGARTALEALALVGEQLGRVPHGGLSYEPLRYVCGDPAVSARMRAFPEPELMFNFLGHQPTLQPPLELAPEPTGPSRPAHAHRSQAFYVTAQRTRSGLRFEWYYSRNLHHDRTIEALVRGWLDALRALLVESTASPDSE